MGQNNDAGVPMTPVAESKQKSGNGLKIITAIACVVAVCGIGFGIYGMTQSSQKDGQISDLKERLEKYEEVSMDEDDQGQNIPEGYIAVFHGGVGERTYATYIYKDNNDHSNYGFTYINTTNTTKSYGSSEWYTEITERGSFTWTDGAFVVAKKNGAYSYVTVPGSNQIYTIEEFQKIFLMN